MFVGGLYYVYNGFRNWQRGRLIQDTPTEKVRSAAAGRTGVEGVGRPVDAPVGRPFSDGHCLVARYEVQEYKKNDDDGTNWETVASGTRYCPIQLDDGTGTLVIEPDDQTRFEFEDHDREIVVDGHEKEPPHVLEFLRDNDSVDAPAREGVTGFLFSERRRYTESVIPVGQQLYAFGSAEPVEPNETNSSGLVLGRDEVSGEFILSEYEQEGLTFLEKLKAPVKMIGGFALAVLGLFLLLLVLVL